MTLKYSYWYAPGMGLQFEVDRGKSRWEFALAVSLSFVRQSSSLPKKYIEDHR